MVWGVKTAFTSVDASGKDVAAITLSRLVEGVEETRTVRHYRSSFPAVLKAGVEVAAAFTQTDAQWVANIDNEIAALCTTMDKEG